MLSSTLAAQPKQTATTTATTTYDLTYDLSCNRARLLYLPQYNMTQPCFPNPRSR